MENNQFYKLYKPFIYVALFCLFYILFLNQAFHTQGPLGNFPSETFSHMIFSQSFMHNGWLQVLSNDFEPLLHIITAILAIIIHFFSNNTEIVDLANSAVLILSLAKLTQFYIIKKIVDANLKLNQIESMLVTIIIAFSTALYLPVFNLNLYMPMSTPNIWVDPTNILLGPFAIVFFYQYINQYIISKKLLAFKKSFILCICLIIATLIKPAFTNIMLVIIGLYYLLHLRRFLSNYLWHDLIIFVPSCIILIIQIKIMSVSPAAGTLIYAPYKVINLFTLHPYVSLFQAIEFPFLVTLISLFRKQKSERRYLYFSWIFCFISYFIYALFSFSGPSWGSANLAWSHQISLTLLYIFSIVEAIKFFTTKSQFPLEITRSVKINNFILTLCAANLGFIFLSGINLFVKIYLGGKYL